MKAKKKFWRKLKNKYKLSILNETTYEEVMHLRLSRLHVVSALSMLSVILVAMTTVLIAFTGLRELIPGYPDRGMRRQITMNALRVDSLAIELEKRDRFFNSIRMVIAGEETKTDSLPADPLPVVKMNYDTIFLGASNEEKHFRELVEERERFNLSLGELSPSASAETFYHCFPPLADGVITARFDESIHHYGIDLVAKQNASVAAVLSGVVIFSDWTMKTGYVIQVQHPGDFVSIYKHNSVLLKKQGDSVRVGEAIAIVGNTGEETTGPHLHFELWRAGKPIDPEKYIKFK
ncbi:MAG: M23 family metallopeptidase [Odoribacteraceae bacterium]|jgi:lipoprotein NlpD|nr:M23 family metallopeptidase [Odoribacteraceae bacterium]